MALCARIRGEVEDARRLRASATGGRRLGRWALVVAASSIGLSAGLPAAPARAQDCYPTGAATTGNLLIQPEPSVDMDVLIGWLHDPDTYVEGSIVVTVTAPDGRILPAPFRPDHGPIVHPDVPGVYTAHATWKVVACRGAGGEVQYADASSPTVSFTVVPRDQKPTVRWFGDPAPGGTMSRRIGAGIRGAIACPNPDRSVNVPITMTVRYSTSGPPTEQSAAFKRTTHCPPARAEGSLALHRKPWGISTLSWQGAGAGATLGHRLHVWIEIAAGGEPLASIRVQITPRGQGAMTMTPEPGACATTCARTWKQAPYFLAKYHRP